MLVPYPPLEAYRRDLARLGRDAFGPNDGRWIAAATLLQRYAEASSAERRDVASRLAMHLAVESELTFCSAGLELAREIEEAGALHLAMSWLTLLEQTIPEDHVLHIGRTRAVRARVARRLGDVETARVLYRDVEQLGESRAEPELTARAWIGFAVMAAERGNYPEARRWYETAALVADDTGCRDESSLAHQGLMIVYAKAGESDRAILAGWKAYRAALADSERAFELLTNLSQLLYELGYHKSALHGFGAVVSGAEHPRTLLGALGGAAMAAAALGQHAVVCAAATRIEKIAPTAWSHPAALALLDLSEAYGILGNAPRASQYRERGLALAEQNSHFELVFRATAEASSTTGAVDPAPPLGTTASRVLEHIDSLAIPADLSLVG